MLVVIGWLWSHAWLVVLGWFGCGLQLASQAMGPVGGKLLVVVGWLVGWADGKPTGGNGKKHYAFRLSFLVFYVKNVFK